MGNRRSVALVSAALMLASAAFSQTSAAETQYTGSELIEEVSAEAEGSDTYVALESVEAFAAGGGGEAVFEPGTPREEVFTYASSDPESNRLIGLSRTSALSHPVGAFVQAEGAPSEPSEPEEVPTQSPAPASEAEGSTPPQDASSAEVRDGDASSQSDGTAVQAAPPDPCYGTTGYACNELLAAVVRDPATWLAPFVGNLDEPCDPDDTGEECAALPRVGNDPGDVCDPDDTGQTCTAFLAPLVGDVLAACDPDDNSQTCDQYPAYASPAIAVGAPLTGAVPVFDLAGRKQCFVYWDILEYGYNKPAFSALIRQYAESKIWTDCGAKDVPWMRTDVYVAHHAAGGLSGSYTDGDSASGAAPGPYHAAAYQSHSIFLWYHWGSLLEWRFTFGWDYKNAPTQSVSICFFALYGGPIVQRICEN